MSNPSKYPNYQVSDKFTEQVMRQVRNQSLPQASLGRRLSLWGTKLQQTNSGKALIVLCQFLAGLLNLSALYILLIGG